MVALMITDEMCKRAIEAGMPDVIQGFSYGPGFSAPHVIRDLTRRPGEQEIWRGEDHNEMMKRIEIERMRRSLAAAFET